METRQREKEKPMVPSKLQKNNCHVTLEANQANRPRNTHSLGFATTSMRGQGHCKNQTRPGQKWKRKRQTATNRTSPLALEAVLCCLSNHVSYQKEALRTPNPSPAAFLQDSSTFARESFIMAFAIICLRRTIMAFTKGAPLMAFTQKALLLLSLLR